MLECIDGVFSGLGGDRLYFNFASGSVVQYDGVLRYREPLFIVIGFKL